MSVFLEALPKNDQSGAFLMVAPGIMWPLLFRAENTDLSLKELLKIRADSQSVCFRNGNMVGVFNQKYSDTHGYFDQNLLLNVQGPVWFVAEDANGQRNQPIFMPMLMKEFLSQMNPFVGWPLLPFEINKVPIPKFDGREIIETIVTLSLWNTLWSDSTDWWFSPTRAVIKGKVVDVKLNQLFCKTYDSTPGVLVRRQHLPNPSEPYMSPLVECVSMTLFTVHNNWHIPLAVAHFDNSFMLVRCQVNCFYNTVHDDGAYFKSFARLFANELEYQKIN